MTIKVPVTSNKQYRLFQMIKCDKYLTIEENELAERIKSLRNAKYLSNRLVRGLHTVKDTVPTL